MEEVENQTIEISTILHCNACAEEAGKALSRIKGVEAIDINARHLKLVIAGCIDPTIALQELKKATNPRACLQHVSKAYEADESHQSCEFEPGLDYCCGGKWWIIEHSYAPAVDYSINTLFDDEILSRHAWFAM